jgi:hypothetical protein
MSRLNHLLTHTWRSIVSARVALARTREVGGRREDGPQRTSALSTPARPAAASDKLRKLVSGAEISDPEREQAMQLLRRLSEQRLVTQTLHELARQAAEAEQAQGLSRLQAADDPSSVKPRTPA